MDDLKERLRAPSYWMSGSSEGHEGENNAPFEAAARIEALEAKVKEAGEAMSLCSREMLEEWFPEHLAEQFIATLAKLQEHSHDA